MKNKDISVYDFITENNLLYNLAALAEYIYENYDKDDIQELINTYSNDDYYFEIGNDSYLVLSDEEMKNYCKNLSENIVYSFKESLINSKFCILDNFISWDDYTDYIIDDYVENFENISGSIYCDTINSYEIYQNE